MSAWRAGKVLWFDPYAGEGLIIDDSGNCYYVHEAAIETNHKKTNTPSTLTDNSEVKFTIYENAVVTQIDRVKEV